jgi:hypothetical protein
MKIKSDIRTGDCAATGGCDQSGGTALYEL